MRVIRVIIHSLIILSFVDDVDVLSFRNIETKGWRCPVDHFVVIISIWMRRLESPPWEVSRQKFAWAFAIREIFKFSINRLRWFDQSCCHPPWRVGEGSLWNCIFCSHQEGKQILVFPFQFLKDSRKVLRGIIIQCHPRQGYLHIHIVRLGIGLLILSESFYQNYGVNKCRRMRRSG